MTVEEIKNELDLIEESLKLTIKINPSVNIFDFAKISISILEKKYDIKENQAMFVVMAAINKFLKD